MKERKGPWENNKMVVIISQEGMVFVLVLFTLLPL